MCAVTLGRNLFCWICYLHGPIKQMENLPTNTTTPTNPPYLWVEEPQQRSTFGILSFCFSTLIICVWSTVHFNIPRRRHSNTFRVFLQVAWLVGALIAPEFLLFLAINERIDAEFFLKKVLESRPELVKPGMIACVRNYLRGRANSKKVSTLCYASAV